MHRRQAAADRLLLVHPKKSAETLWARTAERIGINVTHTPTTAAARRAAAEDGPFGIVVVATTPGLQSEPEFVVAVRDLIRRIGQSEIIVVTERTLGMETCCELVQAGVSGFIDARRNELNDGELSDRLTQAQRRYLQARDAIEKVSAAQAGDSCMVWRSHAMGELLTRAARAAQVSDVPVLIYGESGTGKQLLAEYIHRLDPKRSSSRFLSVNCSAISGALAESTMFGHVKGAYTGAAGSRKGIFRAANGGTVLLDEIGEMDAILQPKLLRVLQEHVVMPLGADEETATDVRIIAATNRRMAALVEEGAFRLDLYQRLNVITLEIPPLRERPEDIPALVRFFLKKYASYCAAPIEAVDPDVYEFLQRCTLEGNVRELENAVRQTLAFKSSGTTLMLSDIPPTVLARAKRSAPQQRPVVLRELADAACRLVESGTMTLPELVSTCERLVLHNSLKNSSTTSADLARQLGLSRRTLYNKISKYRLTDFDRQ